MRPISEARLRANRANAARSTGPKTPQGKARAASNSLRHGFLAEQILVGFEDPENFKAIFDSIVERFQPVDPFELNLVEELTACYWRIRRAWSFETYCLSGALARQPGRAQGPRMDAALTELAAGPKLALIHRYEARNHAMYHRALKSLLALRAERHALNTPTTAPVLCVDDFPGPDSPLVFAQPEPAPPELPNEPKTPSASNESVPGNAPAQPAARPHNPAGRIPPPLPATAEGPLPEHDGESDTILPPAA